MSAIFKMFFYHWDQNCVNDNVTTGFILRVLQPWSVDIFNVAAIFLFWIHAPAESVFLLSFVIWILEEEVFLVQVHRDQWHYRFTRFLGCNYRIIKVSNLHVYKITNFLFEKSVVRVHFIFIFDTWLYLVYSVWTTCAMSVKFSV